MTTSSTVTLTAEQLDAIVAGAVAKALGSFKPSRTVVVDDAAAAKQADKDAKRASYIKRKQETALKLMRERGIHFNVFEKGRKLLIFSDLTFDKARRDGRPESLGKRIWSTAQVESLGGQPMSGGEAVSA